MHTVWILGDQLSPTHAGLARTRPSDTRVLMVESRARGTMLPYHQCKLVLVYSAMRHFAAELRAAGWEVDYHLLENTAVFADAVQQHLQRFQPDKLVLVEPNSYIEQEALTKLARKLGATLELVPTEQFIVPRAEFQHWAGGARRLLMENHYRRVRKDHDWLLESDGEPVGGSWNLDVENRQTFKAFDKASGGRGATWVQKEPDATTRQVIALVSEHFADHPGQADKFWLPVDRTGALQWLRIFLRERLPSFGAFEDLMATGDPFLFHSVLSPMLNLGLLTPHECVEGAIAEFHAGRAPLNSVEGFMRQIIGWREFINGVYWHRGPAYKELNELQAERPLPAWFYTAETPLNCLHHTLRQTLELGWNHHIQRLMVLGNFMLLAGIRPQEALRWFLEMYVDAFDWVMAANVIGMSLYADGGYLATKPYVATSTYIRRMSDYCAKCQFDPDVKVGPTACPYNYLYWNFIDRHTERFQHNNRMRAIVSGWAKRKEDDRDVVRQSSREFLQGHVPMAAVPPGPG